MASDRDVFILKRIIEYCEKIESTLLFFQHDYAIFHENYMFRDLCAMHLLQIGELSNHLSEDFKKEYDGMPWREIRDTRNIVAHGYEKVSPKRMWNTLLHKIPSLQSFCNETVQELEKEEDLEWESE